MLKVNEYGGRQAKVNEKRQCFKGWETLVRNISQAKSIFLAANLELHCVPYYNSFLSLHISEEAELYILWGHEIWVKGHKNSVFH